MPDSKWGQLQYTGRWILNVHGVHLQRIVLQKVEGVVHAQYACSCSCMHAASLAAWPKQHPRSNITVYTISISDSMKATNCSVVSGSRKKIRGAAVEIWLQNNENACEITVLINIFINVYIIIIIDRFYIALFSTVEQTRCTRMWFYMSE